MILSLDEPQKLTDFFNIPPDTTSWGMQFNGSIPNRNQIFTLGQSLKPNTGFSLPDYGLFILAFDIPEKAIFIGIAAEDGKKPEGMLKRFRKYRSHTTGSNIGTDVKVPNNWQDFTINRFQYFQKKNSIDVCSDVRFIIGKIDTQQQEKDHLEHLRYRILDNSNEILDEICRRLWTGSNIKNVKLLNERVTEHDFKAQVLLWAKEV